jgi:hypothetical protein
MKIFQPIFRLLAVTLFAGLAIRVQAENQTSTGIGNIQSVFILPASPAEGRDPFFPESTRTIEGAAPASHSPTAEVASLKVPGISGRPGHWLAIINTHTFAVGEEGDVKTAAGTLHVRCLKIQPDAVLVEINGQVHRIPVESP